MHLAPLIQDLAVILGVAAVTTYVFRKLRQPVVLGYLVAGFIVGPHTPPVQLVTDLPNIQVWADLGIIFVLFSLGLDFSLRKLGRVGPTALFTALWEVSFMVLLGYFTGRFLGWTTIDSIFLGGMLCISSTAILMKTFDELGLRTRIFATQVFGIVVIEDLVAVVLLVGLSTVAMTQTFFDLGVLIAAVRLIIIVGGWFLFGYFLIPSLLKHAGQTMNNEALTVAGTGLCLLMVETATYFGYSAALGAFIMGSILSSTQEAARLETLIQPLRDLFSAVFFVSVGMLADPHVIIDNFQTIALISTVMILGKTVGVTTGSLISGQPLKTSIQVGFSLAQIGEFSFIIAALGSRLEVTSAFLYPVAVSVSVVTAFLSPYLIRAAEPFANKVESLLPARVRSRLAGYSVWRLTPTPPEPGSRTFRASLFRFVLNGIVVTAIFFAVAGFGVPLLQNLLPDFRQTILLGWIGAALCAAPFVWGMFFSFRVPGTSEASAVTFQSFIVHLVTVFWIGALSAVYFSPIASSSLILGGSLILFLLFFRKLESSYRWFEKRLLANIREDGKDKDSALRALAPWDLHLVRVNVHASSGLVGHSLAHSKIRERFGLNIVAIQRDTTDIAAPTASEVLYPGDTLLVLGSDDQLEGFRKVSETPVTQRPSFNLSDFALEKLPVADGSTYCGKSIRDSQIRETHRGLIVGLENPGKRVLNPDPAHILSAGDILWILTRRGL